LKTKSTRSEYNASNAISDELLHAQHAQAQLTATDRMIQQQFINKTMSISDQSNEPEIKKSKKGHLLLKHSNGKPNANKTFWKLDWDQDDYVVDQYSLTTGLLRDNENEVDQNGNFVKKQRLNPNHHLSRNQNNNNNNNNNYEQQQHNNTMNNNTMNNNNTNSSNPHQVVLLGMEDNEPIVLSTTTHTLHGEKLNRTTAFNVITNSLGITRDEATQHLQQQALLQREYQHNLPPAALVNEQQQQGQNIDLSLLPRNKKLLTGDRRHWTEKTLDEMTLHDWTILREDCRIKTVGVNIPNPLRFWKELEFYNVPTGLLDAIKSVGYQKPTGIQRIAMPTSLLNRDIIARAQTGSGKTCSFLIPVLTYISNQPQLNEKTCQDGPYGIILAPARELATQIYDEALKLSRYLHGINIACVIGGKREYSLADRIELIIATPGRLDELLEQHLLVLNQCRYIILDEADKMLDEGFEPQVKNILSHMPTSIQQQRPTTTTTTTTTTNSNSNMISTENIYQDKRRRTMLYSATFSYKVEELAKKYMSPDYVKVEVGDQTYKINPQINQILEWCPGGDHKKFELMVKYINQYNSGFNSKIIIFCARKDNCDFLSRKINELSQQSRYHNNNHNKQSFQRDIKSIVLHSDAHNREENLKGFKEGEYNVLIATDVAGRGIDVKDVTLVINYELPEPPIQQQQQQQQQLGPQRVNPNMFNPIFEAYTHRVGRTGRAGNSGTAVTFLTEKEKKMLPFFKTFLLKNGVKHFPFAMNEIADNESSNKPIML
jgi:ATP-dependent RNA helicase DDX23/PRP28